MTTFENYNRELASIDMEIARLAQLCGVRMLEPGVAEAVLRQFLAQARQRGHGCVRIVHGKGLRSKDSGAVLKQMTDHLLRHHGEVLAFASAPLAQGGTGAALVLLKPQRVGESRLADEQDTALPWR